MESLSSTRGCEGGELQLAMRTSPGSYRSRSAQRCGFVSGNSVSVRKRKHIIKRKLARDISKMVMSKRSYTFCGQ